MAVEIEGHPDNAAAALWGGLVVVISNNKQPEVFHFEPAPLKIVVVLLPSVNLPTSVSRAALPKEVPLADAVYNLGRTALVLEALRTDESLQIDEILELLETQLTSSEVFTALFELEITGRVRCLPGKNYVRTM